MSEASMPTETESLARELRYLQKALDQLTRRVEALEREREPKRDAKAEDWSPRPAICPGEWLEPVGVAIDRLDDIKIEEK